MAQVRTFTHGKAKVVLGLTWVPLSGADELGPAKEFRKLAADHGRFGLFYENAGARYHLAGFAPSTMDTPIGAVSAAAWLAEVVERPTLYLEALDDSRTRYWVLYVRPGGIDPRTDQLLADDDASELIDDILGEQVGGESKIDLVIGGEGAYPSTHMIERATRRTAQLRDLLVGDAPKHRIKQVVGVSPMVRGLGVAAVLLVALGIGGYYARQHFAMLQSQAELEAAAQAQAAEAERLAKLSQERSRQALAQALAEDTATPSPRAVVNACAGLLTRFPDTLGGWRRDQATCDLDTGASHATYQRDSALRGGLATQDSLYADATTRGLQAQMALMADTAIVTGPPVEIPDRTPLTQDQLPDAVQFGRLITSTLQALDSTLPGMAVRTEPPAPRAATFEDPANPGIQTPVPVEQTYNRGTLVVTGSGLWSLLATPLDDPAVSVGQVEFKSAGRELQWTVHATFVTRNTQETTS